MPELTLDHMLAAPPQRVWEVLVDFERYAEWHPYETVMGAARSPNIITVTTRRQGEVIARDKAIVWKAEPPVKLELLVGKFAKRFFHLQARPGGALLKHGLRWSPVLVNRLTTPAFDVAGITAGSEAFGAALAKRVSAPEAGRSSSANRHQRRSAAAKGKA